MGSVATAARSRVRARLGLLALPVALYLGFIWNYGVSVPYQDDWSLVPLLRLLNQGHLTFAALWAQHLQNRVLVPNVLMLALLKLTSFNTKVEMFCGAGLLLLGFLALALAQGRISSRPLELLIPVAFLVFSLIQYVTALHGYAVSLYLIVAAFMLALLCLLRSESSGPGWLVAAMLLGLVASYSSLQGVAIWPAGLVLLVARGRQPRVGLLWVTVGMAALVLYLVGLQMGHDGHGVAVALTHPGLSMAYFLLLAGAVVPTVPRLGLNLNWLVALGAILWLLATVVVVKSLRARGRQQALALPAAVIAMVAAIDLAIVMGRAVLGLGFALDSRYTVFNVWLLAAVFLGWAEIFLSHRRWRHALALAAVGAICLVQVAGSLHSGIAAGSDLRTQHHQEVALLLHYRSASTAAIRQYAIQDPAVFVPRAEYLQAHGLSIFKRS
ncbi:MAG: hypothetical protein ACYCYK_13755 [Candidatus Dormibacteria bacterium]